MPCGQTLRDPTENSISTTTLLLKVFTHRNFVADFIRFKLIFIHKNDKYVFEPPFGGVRE